MPTNNLVIPSESRLRDYFLDLLDGRELDLLTEYANLPISEEDLEIRLQISFRDNGTEILRGILFLVRGH